MTFRFYAQQIFLTYSQIGDRSVSDFIDFFRSLDQPLEKFVVGLENHDDGGRHIHVYAVFESKFQKKAQRFWDWDGVHPNIKTVKGRTTGSDARRVYEYVTKDGNTTVWPEDAQFQFGSDNNTSKYSSVIAASTKEEARALIQSELPRDYVVNLERIEYFLDRHFQRDAPAYVSPHGPDTWDLCPVLERWVAENLGYVIGSGRSTTY